MVAIEIEDIIGPCVITAASAYHMATFAKRVGKARSKYKVAPPATTGDESFVRVFRAQQNCVEFYPIFLANLWSSSLLCHQVPATILGVVYMFAREKYFKGYSEESEKRLVPFRVSLFALIGLSSLNVFGVGHLIFVRFTGKTLFEMFK